MSKTYSRYASTPVVSDGIRTRNMFRKPLDTTPHSGDTFYTVTAHDRIDLIAWHKYNDPTFWWVIADYNNLMFPLAIESGQKLRLPSYEHLVMDLLESVG